MIELLFQVWDGVSWENYSRNISSYAPTGIDEFKVEVNTYNLFNNYPNPFNPTTKISWQSPVSSWQTLKVYDVIGNDVATLVDEFRPAGSYEVEFTASNLASGIYFYQLKTGSLIETKKMILLR